MYAQVKAYSDGKKSRIMDHEKWVLTSKNGASCLRGTPGYYTVIQNLVKQREKKPCRDKLIH